MANTHSTEDETALEKIFSEELTSELGFSQSMRSRVLHALKDRDVYSEPWKEVLKPPIITLPELQTLSEEELAEEPRIGTKSFEYVMDMLAVLGIPLKKV